MDGWLWSERRVKTPGSQTVDIGEKLSTKADMIERSHASLTTEVVGLWFSVWVVSLVRV
jgi:hypothetical protein